MLRKIMKMIGIALMDICFSWDVIVSNVINRIVYNETLAKPIVLTLTLPVLPMLIMAFILNQDLMSVFHKMRDSDYINYDFVIFNFLRKKFNI